MHKKLHKVWALVMAVLLFLSSTFTNVNHAYAAEADENGAAYETTFAISELTVSGGWGYTAIAGEDAVSFNFSQKYAEVDYAIPEEVVKAGVLGYKVDVSSTDYLGLKILGVGGQLKDAYWTNSITLQDGTEDPTAIGFMNTAESELTYTFKTVTFITANEVAGTAPVTEPEKPTEEVSKILTVTGAELGLTERWNGSATAADGKMEFPSNYYEFVGTLPQEIPYESIESITFNVSEQTGSFAAKFYNAKVTPTGTETDAAYGFENQSSYTYTPKGDGSLTQIGFMSHVAEADYPMTVKLDSVVITLKGEAPVVEPEKPVEEITELVYNENLTFTNRWNTSQVEANTLTFGAQYNEFVFDLGKTFNAANVESVKVAFAEPNKDVSIKFYGEGFAENFVEYHNTGATEYTFDKKFDGELRYIGIMSILEGEEAYPYTVTVSSITVKVNNKVIEPEKPATESGLDEYTELAFKDRWTGTPATSQTLSFDSRYQEYVVDLGKTYSTSEVNTVTVSVKDQGNLICIKYYDSEMGEMQPNYDLTGASEYSIAPNYDGDLRYIGIMSLPDAADGVYPYSVTVEKISVSYTPTVYEETWTFGPDELSFVNNWTGEAAESTKLTYSQEWEEYTFTLPKSVRADKIKSLNIKVKDQGLVICFKLYSGSTEVAPFYDQVGRTEYGLSYGGDEDITAIAVMAMDKQDDVFPASVTIEEIKMVIDTTPDTEPPVEKGVEYDIVNLRDEMTAVLGDDFIVGTAISSAEFADSMEMELVTKHFNGVTLGNELKPDSMLKSNAEKVMVQVGDEEILFPVLNFSTPDRYLDYFVNWNNENPDKKIRIRGHVLVWHSQTPDFFFREDYDTSKPYVTPEVMNKRLEAYIRAVCEHYTSEGSKYKDLFYGWDVVNEAISDGSGTYRNANENSTWWRVYGSPEFINNAFVYANRYMPANIALFYNDYNAYQPNKAKGILKLIENVKATPGSRIDGMGMQAHYFCEDNNPTMEAVKKAATDYGKLVDQVQFTEIDFKGSTGPKDEQLAKRYKDLYDTVRRLINEGTNVTGFTIWGVVDKHSWLQQQNNAGGGSTTNSKQYPLLFDNNYKAKNAFYALCDAGELEPEIKNISLIQMVNNDFTIGEDYTYADGKVTFVPMWDENGVIVLVYVDDAEINEKDSVTLYVGTDEIHKATATKESFGEEEFGYYTILSVALSEEEKALGTLKLDLTVTDGDNVYAFNDTTLSQDTISKYYASAVKKPLLSVNKGTIKVDGVGDDEAWDNVPEVPLTINLGAEVEATAKLLWDEEYLYVLMDVTDAVLNADAKDEYQQDSVEVFIDENNAKTSGYQDDDKQYRINYNNLQSFNGTKCNEENIVSAAVITEEGYIVEAAFKWTDIEAKAGTKVGLELQINDANATGKRSGTLSWSDNSGNGWSSTEVFGTILLYEEKAVDPTPSTPAPAPSTSTGDSSSSSASSQNASAAGTQAATTTEAAPATEVPGRIAPSQGRPAAEAPAEETVEAPAEEEAVPAPVVSDDTKETAAEETQAAEVEVEDSETALADGPVVATVAESRPFPAVAVAVIVVLALGAAGGVLWLTKFRHLVK